MSLPQGSRGVRRQLRLRRQDELRKGLDAKLRGVLTELEKTKMATAPIPAVCTPGWPPAAMQTASEPQTPPPR